MTLEFRDLGPGGELLRSLGLAEGDEVLKVNGRTIPTGDVKAAWAACWGALPMQLSIRRLVRSRADRPTVVSQSYVEDGASRTISP